MINKKKKEEFVNICTNEARVKILFLQGPSGSGKNSMIDCFGEQYNYEIVRYRDDKSKMVYDLYDDGGVEDPEDRFYPDDLENLIYYIRSNAKASMTRL